MPDEYLTEQAIAETAIENAQDTDAPTNGLDGRYSSALGEYETVWQSTTSVNFASCSAWTGPSYSYVSGNPPYPYATSASYLWYGADFEKTTGSYNYGSQMWVQP